MTNIEATAPSGRATSAAIEFLRNYGALIGMVAVFLLIGFMKPSFLHAANISNVLRQSTILVIISLGLTVVMVMRGVDLSIAQITDAAAIMAAGLLIHGEPAWVAFLAPVALGAVLGGINGVLMAYLGIPAIIGSLGMMFVIRSGELIYTHGSEPQILFTLPKAVTEGFLFLGKQTIGPVPALVILAAAMALLAYALMALTPFGRQAKAVGSNVRAAYLAGIDIRLVFGAGFVVSGLMAAVAGVAMASRTGIAVPRGAEPYLLDAFAAAYLGTLASRTGAMTIPGTLIGALFVAFLGNGLTMLGFSAPYRYAFNGGFILLAMAVGALRRMK
ncbi:ABC transporter permease [Labrys monachus]|uniref:Ribose/xylose/arabinose/galactoside ABC-type transport system permease subunit n=1 Tax=Labrys monachus TaxID=217067 RepID=A0ABU0FD07_9HYPH|nr:ABC transporter permease [Labrys monachus]MDQ0392488.1 ribose/xylose/arabinose/galactoside ABC-type transport system permease subunit [Labrys monachus]